MGHPCPHPASFPRHAIEPLSLNLGARMSRSVCPVEVPCKSSSIRANLVYTRRSMRRIGVPNWR
jgi:hypothetical protein